MRWKSNSIRDPGTMSQDLALALVHGLNRAARPLDRALFAPRSRGTVPDPIFIVGPARSGTTLLFQALAHAARVSYLPQALDYGYGASNLVFRVFGRRMARHSASFHSRYGRTSGLLGPSEAFGFWRQWFWKGPEGDHRHEAPLSVASASSLRAAAGEIAAHQGRPLLVKCLYLSLSVPALASAFPGARFIFATRDAVATAESSLLAKASAGGRHDWWSTRPAGYLDMAGRAPEDQVLWQLGTIAATISADLATLDPRRWVRVRYEALCEDPRGTLKGVLDQFALDAWEDNELPARFTTPSSPAAAPGQRRRLEDSAYFRAAVEALE